MCGFDPSETRKVPWIEASAEIQKRNLVVMEVWVKRVIKTNRRQSRKKDDNTQTQRNTQNSENRIQISKFPKFGSQDLDDRHSHATPCYNMH